MNGLGFGPLATYRALSTELMSRVLSLSVGGGRVSCPRERSSMSPVRHRPNKPELPSETSLWRYFDLDGALNLLSTNTLKFTQLAKFDDGFGGRQSPAEIAQNNSDRYKAGIPIFEKEQESARPFEIFNRHHTYASCWTTVSPNSMLMWSIYAPRPESVADSHNPLAAVWSKWDYYAHESEVRLHVDANNFGESHGERCVCQEPESRWIEFGRNAFSRVYAHPGMGEDLFEALGAQIASLKADLRLERTGIRMEPKGD